MFGRHPVHVSTGVFTYLLICVRLLTRTFPMHPTVSCVSLVWASTAIAADFSVPPIAYQAEAVADATMQTQQVWSDGVHTRGESTASNDDKSGYYTDSEKKLTWVYGPTFPCVQVPSHASTSPKI